MARRNNPDPRTDSHSPAEALVRLGMMVLHSLIAVLSAFQTLLGGIGRMLKYTAQQAARFFVMIWQNIRFAFNEYNRPMQERLREMRHARKEGGIPLVLEWLRFFGGFIFGENGILRTGFNYVLPVMSVLFLVGLVSYGTGLDYALSVTVNGEELGIIADERDFAAAQEEVRKRVSLAGEEVNVSFSPVYTLKIVTENDQYVSPRSIADRLLTSSHTDLETAYGVYVDGEFIGAVIDKDAVASRMSAELAEYAVHLDNNVTDVYYTKEITYSEGIYLASSLSEPAELLKKLTASEKQEQTYTVREADSPQLVAAMYHMTLEELQELNPKMGETLKPGTELNVTTSARYIPIAYTRNMTVTSYINYGSVRVETSALNLGVEAVIAKGELGERTSEVQVEYIDGVEESRTILSTVITKEPVPEQIGIGTYSPAPASTGTIVRGSGKFGWPVGGGYISDHFGGARRHKGLDIAAPMGTEIYAAEGGTVYRAGWNSGGYGNYVIIDHPDGYRTLYGHCSSVVAYEGQIVEKGQLIAYVGSTGDSTGPHCHFEVRINNICQNPEDYLRVNAD